MAPSSPSFAPGSGPGVEPTEPESTSVSGGEDGRSITPSPPEPEESEPEASPETETETEEEKALRLLYCSLCKVAVNSASQLDAHNTGEQLLRAPALLNRNRSYLDTCKTTELKKQPLKKGLLSCCCCSFMKAISHSRLQ